jgi:hypothetical protein
MSYPKGATAGSVSQKSNKPFADDEVEKIKGLGLKLGENTIEWKRATGECPRPSLRRMFSLTRRMLDLIQRRKNVPSGYLEPTLQPSRPFRRPTSWTPQRPRKSRRSVGTDEIDVEVVGVVVEVAAEAVVVDEAVVVGVIVEVGRGIKRGRPVVISRHLYAICRFCVRTCAPGDCHSVPSILRGKRERKQF